MDMYYLFWQPVLMIADHILLDESTIISILEGWKNMGRKRGRKPKTDKNYRKDPQGRRLRKGESFREDKGLYYYQYRDVLNKKRYIYDR